MAESSVDIVDSQGSAANMKFWIVSLLLLVAYVASAPVQEETTKGECWRIRFHCRVLSLQQETFRHVNRKRNA